MNDFLITTENTCDLPDTYLSEHNIKKAFLHYYLEGVEYPSENFNAKDFYDKLRKGMQVSTSQPNAYEFETLWTPFLIEGKNILHLAFSSVLSGTFANACAVAKRLCSIYGKGRITVIDSKCQSSGQGLFVRLVSEFKENGHSYEECIAYAEGTIQKINHIFAIDDLRWLAPSGRVSNAEAFIGNILQIKPLLYTNEEGRLTPYSRVISRKLALNGLCDKIKYKFTGEYNTIYITHSDCLDEVKYVANRLLSTGAQIEIFDLNPIIGCHTGPGTIAIFFVSDNRKIR